MATSNSLKFSRQYTYEPHSTGYRTGFPNSKLKDTYNNVNVYNSVSNSIGYIFKERSGRLRWKDIISLDIESMIRTNDLTPLENYLENLIFSTIDENDLQIVPEPNILKLIKTYQYILEYLLYTQQKLENENKILETNYTQLVQEAMNKENILKDNKSVIRSLKKEKREKEMVLNTYKCVIDEYKSKPEKLYFFCKFCSGKKFSSESALNEHFQRRHGDQNISKTSNKPNIDEKMDQMKTYFETYVKSFQNESYMKMVENQKNLENKLIEIKNEKKNEINDIEYNFKNTLLEMKELIVKNSNIGNTYQQSSVIEKRDETTDKHYEETMDILKSQAKYMNDILVDMNKAQNDKIQSVIEQLNYFKQNISEEFNILKQQKIKKKEKEKDKEKEKEKEKEKDKEFDKDKDKEKENVKEISISYEKKYIPEKITHAESIEFVKKEIPKITKKSIFNAGPLESDYSEEEIKVSTPIKRVSTIKPTHTFRKEESKEEKTIEPKVEVIKPPPIIESPVVKKEEPQPTIEEIEPAVEKSKNNFFMSQESIKGTASIPNIVVAKESKTVKVGKREVDKKKEELAILFDDFVNRDKEYFYETTTNEYITKM